MSNVEHTIKGFQLDNKEIGEIVTDAVERCTTAIESAINEAIGASEISVNLIRRICGDNLTIEQLEEALPVIRESIKNQVISRIYAEIEGRMAEEVIRCGG